MIIEDGRCGELERSIKEKQTERFGKYAHLDEEFRYQLLGRLHSDCDYYLGYGYRHPRNLWANNESDQITFMRLLYASFPDDKKPEWLTLEQIDEYESKMCSDR